MLSRLRQQAWLWWLHNPTLQAFNDTQEDCYFEDFCVDLMVEIAVDELRPDIRDMDEIDAENYLDTVNFDFNLICADELIEEFEREEE